MSQEDEFAADLGSLALLEKLGEDPSAYLHLLLRLQEYRDNHRAEAREPYGWLDNRVTCLKSLIESGPRVTNVGKSALSEHAQYNMCVMAQLRLSPSGRARVLAWLARPGDVDLLSVLRILTSEDLGILLVGDPKAKIALRPSN